jgi:DNA-binding GntR family transcriptional regulator
MARTTRSEGIRRKLGERIVSGEFLPGCRLDETKLSAEFGVSRTPVREALRELGAEGLVRIIPNRGVFVLDLEADYLAEEFEVMGELEARCAAFAAHRMTVLEKRALELIHAEAESAHEWDDPDVYQQHNRKFHDAIYSGAHNRSLEKLTCDYRRRLSPFRNEQLRDSARIQASNREHSKIVELILDGDAAGAERAMRSHISSASVMAYARYLDNRAKANVVPN